MDQRKRAFDDTSQKSRLDTKKLRIIDRDEEMETLFDQRTQVRPDPAVTAAFEEKIRKLNDTNKQLEAEMGQKNQQLSFEIKLKDAKLKRLEDKLDRANTQTEAEKQQVTELENRLNAAKRQEERLNESLQQLEWEYKGATDRLSRFESALRQKDDRIQELTALIPSRDVNPAELRRLNDVFLLKQQISTLQDEKQLVIQQRDASIATVETLRADIDRDGTAHGIEIERIQKHVKTLEAEKERLEDNLGGLERRMAEFIATFETFEANKKVDRETIAAYIQIIETPQEVNRSLVGESRKLEEKRCRDNESFQVFYSQSEIALASNIPKSLFNASSPNQASINSLESPANIRNFPEIEAIPQNHAATFHQRPSLPPSKLSRSTASPMRLDQIPPFSAMLSRSSSIYSSIYSSPNDGGRNALHAASESAEDLSIQQGDSPNPFNASNSGSSESNPHVAGTAGVLNVHNHQNNIQSPPTAASSSTYSSPYNAVYIPVRQSSLQIGAAPGRAGDLRIQQGNSPGPFNASSSRCNDTNVLMAGPVSVLIAPVHQSDIQIRPRAEPGPAGGLNVVTHQNIASNAPAAPGPVAHSMAVMVRPYSFLISGTPGQGPRTMDVPVAMLTTMDRQVAEWEDRRPGTWSKGSGISGKRCIDSRLSKASTRINPLPADPQHSTACPHCVASGRLCAVVRTGFSPVVVPLPPSHRAPHLTHRDLGYYVNC